MIALYVLALMCSGDDILLARRYHATFGEGLYSMIGGKVEAGETALHGIRREVQEETGLDIPENLFSLIHTFHRKGAESELIALVFKVDILSMQEPVNKEPDKHDDMRFFNINNLPNNIIPAHKQAIECIKNNISYSQHGWE